MVLSAQMGKAGPPMNGKDLHVGDFACGILPAAAPLAIGDADDGRAWRWRSRARAAGASRCRSSARAGRRSASGTRRSTCAPRGGCRPSSASRTIRPRCRRRSASSRRSRVFADKAAGYGIPGITIDGTDPDEIAAAFAWAVERARAGRGPGAHRARLHAHVRPRAPRRHAVSRQGPAAGVGVSAARARRATPIASSTRTGRRAIRFRPMPRGWTPRGSSTAGSSTPEAGSRGDRRVRGAAR